MSLGGYQNPNAGLNQSINNNFYTSGIGASQMNGTGSTVQTNKLNLSRNQPTVVVAPGPVQIVEQPIEVIKTIKVPVYQQGPDQVVQNPLDKKLRDLLAETDAKVALLIMENNRIKWRIAQKDAELTKLRGGVKPVSPVVNNPNNTFAPVKSIYIDPKKPPVNQPYTTSTFQPARMMREDLKETQQGEEASETASGKETPAGPPRVVLEAKDTYTTKYRVDGKEVMVDNKDLARLEQIRKERELMAKEKELLKQQQEQKKGEKTELEKLQEKLALKNKQKGKKGKKR